MTKAQTATAASPATPEPPFTLVRKDDPTFMPGRRDFLTYRDLGITAASGGRIRAQITDHLGQDRPHAADGLAHAYLRGADRLHAERLDRPLTFEDQTIRIEEGDSLYIPGGIPHNEIATSETFDLIEISVPADMGTEPCDPPPGRRGEA